MKKLHAALGLLAVGIGIAALQCELTVRQYTVKSAKIAQGDELRIVMLSDLHSYIYPQNQAKLLTAIREQQPDLIALCGDIVDENVPEHGAELLLDGLADIAPCYYVSGNHEFWSNHTEQIFEKIASYGVTLLRDASHEFTIGRTDYRLCGVDDPAVSSDRVPGSYGEAVQYRAALQKFSDLPDDSVNILLAHRPEYIADYAALPFDLTLCGHAHGGQWRIPFLLNGLLAPNQGFFPKYAGGRYSYEKMTEIVGRGLLRDWKPRIFNPPELVVIDMQKE